MEVAIERFFGAGQNGAILIKVAQQGAQHFSLTYKIKRFF
jgi:hypothetical protein